MNGHVFQTTAERKNNQQFERTLEALQAYAFKNLDNANDIMPILRNLQDEEIPEPADISDEGAKSKLKQRGQVCRTCREVDTKCSNHVFSSVGTMFETDAIKSASVEGVQTEP